jgi:hypothetical protein
MTPKTVSEAFIRWMTANNFGIYNENVYLNLIPDDAPDEAWWVITSGGDVDQLNVTRESIQRFDTTVFYRNKSSEEVEHNLFALNQKVNGRDTLEIEGFDLYSISATMPEDEDSDAEYRQQGSFTVAIQIYVS